MLCQKQILASILGYGARGTSPTSQNILQEALAQEMMAGQGGLGPAPVSVFFSQLMIKKQIHLNSC